MRADRADRTSSGRTDVDRFEQMCRLVQAGSWSVAEFCVECEINHQRAYDLLHSGRIEGATRIHGTWIIPKWAFIRNARPSSATGVGRYMQRWYEMFGEEPGPMEDNPYLPEDGWIWD